MKMDKKYACTVTYFGDGGTSEVMNYCSKVSTKEQVISGFLGRGIKKI